MPRPEQTSALENSHAAIHRQAPGLRAVVAARRANNFDLRESPARHWTNLGPRRVGPLHVHAAAADPLCSHFAVHRLDGFMQSNQNPPEPGQFLSGPPGPRHGWQPLTPAALVQTRAEHIARPAPAGENPAAPHH